ncbi:uncharacterized protein [Ptychodera flava]|uniref:uncharacterized protein n=1 Tax=Ptychodera flava TaxID=63121 RepID=UPI00396A7EFF
MIECNQSITLDNALRHNDKLHFHAISSTGGFIKINNYDVPGVVTINNAEHYSTTSAVFSNTIIFDFYPPQHCLDLSPPCAEDIILVDQIYSKNSSIAIAWKKTDWQDDSSGVRDFNVEVHKVTFDPNISREGLIMGIQEVHSLNKNKSEMIFEFPEAGLYAIVLTVDDNVANFARARRFVFYDDISSIAINTTNPITVSSTVNNSGILWLGITSGQVTVSWAGHFYNSFHRDSNLLAAIEEMDPPLPAEYDETFGQPPLTRSREAIPNVEGITRFQFDYTTSRSGKTWPEWRNITGHEIYDLESCQRLDTSKASSTES